MSRIDRASLDHAHFPVTAKLPTRFADLDLQGHVNNAAIPVILQESRVEFNKVVDLGSQLGQLRPMVAGITIEYTAELTHPGEIEILTGVSRVGRTSFTIQQIARQKGRTAIYAETTMVIADSRGAAVLPNGLKCNLEKLLLRQTGEGANGND